MAELIFQSVLGKLCCGRGDLLLRERPIHIAHLLDEGFRVGLFYVAGREIGCQRNYEQALDIVGRSGQKLSEFSRAGVLVCEHALEFLCLLRGFFVETVNGLQHFAFVCGERSFDLTLQVFNLSIGDRGGFVWNIRSGDV